MRVRPALAVLAATAALGLTTACERELPKLATPTTTTTPTTSAPTTGPEPTTKSYVVESTAVINSPEKRPRVLIVECDPGDYTPSRSSFVPNNDAWTITPDGRASHTAESIGVHGDNATGIGGTVSRKDPPSDTEQFSVTATLKITCTDNAPYRTDA